MKQKYLKISKTETQVSDTKDFTNELDYEKRNLDALARLFNSSTSSSVAKRGDNELLFACKMSSRKFGDNKISIKNKKYFD